MSRYPKVPMLRLFGILICVAGHALADESEHLFGNWGGLLPKLEESGVTLESILTNDLVGVASGGKKRNIKVVGDYDLTATVDSEKAGLWSDGTFFFYFLGSYGGDPSVMVGDYQWTSNIEAYSTAKLNEAWYDHKLLDGKASFLVGLHDMNSEFYTLDHAATLLNSSFGMGTDVTQVISSIWSTTALGARLSITPTDNSYFLTAVYDGVPGDPKHPHGTQIKFDSGDGVYWISELGLHSAEGEPLYKLASGAWYQTTEFEDFAGHERDRNGGLYIIGEATILPEDDSARGLGVFFQVGLPKEDRNQIGRYVGAGLTYTGLIPCRDEDVLSIGVARAQNSGDFRELNLEAATAETAFELTYRVKVLPYLALQPDIQIVRNPGPDKMIQDAIIVGMRFELAM